MLNGSELAFNWPSTGSELDQYWRIRPAMASDQVQSRNGMIIQMKGYLSWKKIVNARKEYYSIQRSYINDAILHVANIM